MSDVDWLLSKPFSEIEDGDLLSQWQSTLPESERDLLTFVISVTDKYDHGPPDVSGMPLSKHPKVSFLFFSDDNEYNVTPPWKHVKISYPVTDTRMDLGYKNSISSVMNSTEKRTHYLNMYSKYFCHLFWRVPEIRRSRFVGYLGGGMNIMHMKVKFYDDLVELSNQGYHRLLMEDWGKTVVGEANEASLQQRYRVDNVSIQAEIYRDNYKMPISDIPTYWLGLVFHDNFHTPTRQVMFDTWAECQLWSLEDQMSFPFALFHNKELNTTKGVSPSEWQSWLGIPDGETFRFQHTVKNYGV